MRRVLTGVALVVIGAGGLGVAAIAYDHRGYHTPAAAGVVPAVRPAAATPDLPLTAGSSAGAAARSRPRSAPPLRVTISAIHVDAAVVPVSVHDGALDVPGDPQSLGWWVGGARAGAASGSVVVVGHVDSWRSGPGALFHLESVPVGARVAVTSARGVTAYRVVGRRVYPKQSLPASVFATTGRPRLVLITCGGPFDAATRHYADNVVVYAVPD